MSIDKQNVCFPYNSPFEATQALRRIASLLMLVETPTDPHVWQTALGRWEKQYGYMLKEKTHAPTGMTRHWWYTHGIFGVHGTPDPRSRSIICLFDQSVDPKDQQCAGRR